MAHLFAQFLDSLGPAAMAGPGAPDVAVRVGSDLLLAGAFLALPVVFRRTRRRKPASSRSLSRRCGAWAALCGVVYLADALALLTPLAGTAGVVKVAAAVGSWVALLGVIRALPRGPSAVEEAARDADLERLRLLEAAVTASADGVMIAETARGAAEGTAKILYANPAFERLTGYLASEAVGQSPSILHDSRPTDGGAAPDPLRSALKGREAIRVEAPNRRKDGSRLWSEWHVVPVTNAEGRCTHWIAILRDTTARRREKEELRQTRDFLTSLLDNFPVPVHVTDEHGRYRMVNPAWERATGISRDRAVGKSPDALFPKAVAAEFGRQTAAVRAGAKPAREKLQLEMKGDKRVFLAVAFPLPGPDGRAGLVGGVALDVTDQTRAEQAVHKLNGELKRRVEEVEALVDLSPVGIAVAEDPGGQCIRVNRALRELLGLPPEEDPELTPAPVRLGMRFRRGGADLPPDETPMRRCLATGRPVEAAELQIVVPDGRERTVVNSARPLFDEAGRVRGCLSVYTDITERKRLEEQYRQAQKMEAVGRLAGGIAHDFNNLLTVITGYGEMLRDGLADNPDAHDLADEVCRAGARAAALTRQLLAFSRRSVLEPRVLDVNAAVGEAGKMIRRLIGETVDLRCELAADPAWVRTDPGHLDQVILNLVVNARDAMPDGGRVTIRTRAAELTEAAAREPGAVGDDARPGAYVVLEVSDTGHGMTEDVQRHMFEPFFTTKVYGSGLGLATVYGIVKQSGGHIRVASEPGRGTEFAVYLPRVEPSPAAGPAPAVARAGTETILLAEDEDGVRGFAGAALRAAGYTVLEASDGQEAVRVADAHPERIDLL